MPFKRVPLSKGFMLVGIFGFVGSIIYWNSGKLSPAWGFLFALLSLVVFIASIITLRQSIELESKSKT